MQRILGVIVIALTGFAIIKASTFGWRFWSKSFIDTTGEDFQLAKRLRPHVYKLADEIGERSVFRYDKLEESAGYITQAFESFGYSVEFQNYNLLERRVKNIIATKIGITRPEEIIIVGAHYDSCFNPGANDNASAVAGLIELARFISDKKTSRTVKLIAFVNEEPPFFKTEQMGSRVYAKAARQAKDDIRAVLILETIGYYSDKPNSQQYPPLFGLFYPNKANFIAVVGNFSSGWLIKEVVSSFKTSADFPIESVVTFSFVPGVDFSDHWSFWKEGYPAVMITDTAFYRYTHYHSSSDTSEKLNYEKMAGVVKGLGAVLIGLAK